MSGSPGFAYPVPSYPTAIPSEASFALQTNNTLLTLSSVISASSLTLPFFESIAALPNSGILVVEGERIRYDGKAGSNSLTLSNVNMRGWDGSVAATHAQGTVVSVEGSAWQHNKLVVELRATMAKVDTLSLTGSVLTPSVGGLQGGGPVSTNPSISLLDRAINPGTYSNPVLTVNAKGIITDIVDGTPGGYVPTTRRIDGASGHIVGGGDLTADRTLALATIPALVAQAYNRPASVSVDAYGRVTAITAGANPPTFKTMTAVGGAPLGAGATGTFTIFWPSAWPDANYAVVATVTGNSSPTMAQFVVNVYGKTTTYVQFSVTNVGTFTGSHTVTFIGYEVI